MIEASARTEMMRLDADEENERIASIPKTIEDKVSAYLREAKPSTVPKSTWSIIQRGHEKFFEELIVSATGSFENVPSLHLNLLEYYIFHLYNNIRAANPVEESNEVNELTKRVTVCGQIALQIACNEWCFKTVSRIAEQMIIIMISANKEREALKYLSALQSAANSQSVLEILMNLDGKPVKRYEKLSKEFPKTFSHAIHARAVRESIIQQGAVWQALNMKTEFLETIPLLPRVFPIIYLYQVMFLEHENYNNAVV